MTLVSVVFLFWIVLLSPALASPRLEDADVHAHRDRFAQHHTRPPVAVPEPDATVLLVLGLGAVGVGAIRQQQGRRQW